MERLVARYHTQLYCDGSSDLSLRMGGLSVETNLSQWAFRAGLEVLDGLVTGRCQHCCWHDLSPCFIIFLPHSDLLL